MEQLDRKEPEEEKGGILLGWVDGWDRERQSKKLKPADQQKERWNPCFFRGIPSLTTGAAASHATR